MEKTIHILSRDEILKAGKIFYWATQDDYKLWFFDSLARSRRMEVMLPRLVRNKKLVSKQVGKKLVYAVPSHKNESVIHGLGCTQMLIRISKSTPHDMVYLVGNFRGIGSIPDVGFQYGEKLLLCEFSTENNFEGAKIIKTKMTKYIQNLDKILERFKVYKAKSVIVLFVIDVSRERVLNFVKRNNLNGMFYFTDYETFKSVSIGTQLSAPIYIWIDGESYPLKKC